MIEVVISVILVKIHMIYVIIPNKIGFSFNILN